MATSALPGTAASEGRGWLTDGKLLFGIGVLLVILQIELVFAKSINWDEFFHFNQIHAHLRGDKVQWLQTPHIRLFGWVPGLSGEPIDHIQWIRLMLLPLGILTSLAIFDIARRFFDTRSAAIAALAYFGGGYVFQHSFALRADMIAASLLTSALWVLLTRNRSIIWEIAASALCALAFVSTVKAVLFAPALAAVAWWRWRDVLSVKLVLGAGLLAVTACAVFWFVAPEAITRSITGLLTASLGHMFSAGLFPQGKFLIVQLATAPVLTALVIYAFAALRHEANRMPIWLLVGLILPLAWTVIYRNSFPYFFAFILPPVAIGGSLGATLLCRRYGFRLVAAALLIAPVISSAMLDRDVIDRQRSAHAGIAQIFTEPVRYIDDVAFRPDFPRAVPHFASGWALANYRKKAEPTYSEAMAKTQPPLLIRQGYALENLAPDPSDELALLPEDTAALAEHYIPHWGIVHVAGKRIDPSKSAQTIEIVIAGTYTVEDQSLIIDDEAYAAGETVDLDAGKVTLGPFTGAAASLRWGDNLPKPTHPFPDGKLFTTY